MIKNDSVHLQVYTVNGVHLGYFDGEFFYMLSKNSLQLEYRVDGSEIYTLSMPCEYVGDIVDNKGIALNGEVLFELR